MKDFHGLIFAYYTDARLRELVSMRTAASLPFCGRYRVIDFSLSAMRNAGIVDVGVIMQRDYQSLLDHLGGGKAWDMARRTGGLRMLPPFGLPEYHRGNYAGTMEALIAVSSYIKDVKAKYFVLMLGDMCANIDLTLPMEQHRKSGSPITAICTDRADAEGFRMTYLTDEQGKAKQILVDAVNEKEGLLSLEAYIINKDKQHIVRDLKNAMSKCDEVILATDPDREGEAIAWHLKELLKLSDDTTDRITFHEITESAIKSLTNQSAVIVHILLDSLLLL